MTAQLPGVPKPAVKGLAKLEAAWAVWTAITIRHVTQSILNDLTFLEVLDRSVTLRAKRVGWLRGSDSLSDVYLQNQLLVEGHPHGAAALDAVSRVLEFGMPR
jgi:hypothetical protein